MAATRGRPLRVDLSLAINPSTGAATGTLRVGLDRRDR
jgi:hypothetical protein